METDRLNAIVLGVFAGAALLIASSRSWRVLAFGERGRASSRRLASGRSRSHLIDGVLRRRRDCRGRDRHGSSAASSWPGPWRLHRGRAPAGVCRSRRLAGPGRRGDLASLIPAARLPLNVLRPCARTVDQYAPATTDARTHARVHRRRHRGYRLTAIEPCGAPRSSSGNRSAREFFCWARMAPMTDPTSP